MYEYYDYSDVHLIPNNMSKISSRSEISTQAIIGDYLLDVPLVAAPMMDVVNKEVAKTVMESGAYAILPRFKKPEEILADWNACPPQTGMSIGIQKEDIEKFNYFYSHGVRYFCVDVANGANYSVVNFIKKVARTGVYFIAGNIGHKDTYSGLLDEFAYDIAGVRIGVSIGKACHTQGSTGVYTPMASLISSIQEVKHNYNTAVIADGGIREPQDFCKAIALGADLAMAGSIFATCADSAAQTDDSGVYKVYRGSASYEIQKTYKDTPRYIEGKRVELTCSEETISEMIQRYSEGLRSSMSYFGAKDIEQFQNYSNFSYA